MCAMHSVVCIENVFLLISFQFHLRYLDRKYKKIIGFIESDRVSKKMKKRYKIFFQFFYATASVQRNNLKV